MEKRKLESVSLSKFKLGKEEMIHVKGAGPTSTYREINTYAPDCSCTVDRQLVDVCFPYPF